MTRRSSAPRPPRARCADGIDLQRQGGAGHRRVERARPGDGARPGGARRARDPHRPRRAEGRGRRGGDSRLDREPAGRGRGARARLAEADSRLRGTLPGAPPDAPHPRQQRRRHGMPAGEDRRRLRAPVRLEPRRPLPDDLPARAGAAPGRAEPRRLGQLARPSHVAGRLRRHPVRAPPVRQVARLRPGEDGQRALRGRPRSTARGARRARQCPAPGRHHDRAQPTPAGGGLRVPPDAHERDEVQVRRGRRRDLGVRRHRAGARGTRRSLPRGLPRRRA